MSVGGALLRALLGFDLAAAPRAARRAPPRARSAPARGARRARASARQRTRAAGTSDSRARPVSCAEPSPRRRSRGARRTRTRKKTRFRFWFHPRRRSRVSPRSRLRAPLESPRDSALTSSSALKSARRMSSARIPATSRPAYTAAASPARSSSVDRYSSAAADTPSAGDAALRRRRQRARDDAAAVGGLANAQHRRTEVQRGAAQPRARPVLRERAPEPRVGGNGYQRRRARQTASLRLVRAQPAQRVLRLVQRGERVAGLGERVPGPRAAADSRRRARRRHGHRRGRRVREVRGKQRLLFWGVSFLLDASRRVGVHRRRRARARRHRRALRPLGTRRRETRVDRRALTAVLRSRLRAGRGRAPEDPPRRPASSRRRRRRRRREGDAPSPSSGKSNVAVPAAVRGDVHVVLVLLLVQRERVHPAKVTRRRFPGVGRNGSAAASRSRGSAPVPGASWETGRCRARRQRPGTLTATRTPSRDLEEDGFPAAPDGDGEPQRDAGFGFERLGGTAWTTGGSSTAASREVSKSNGSGLDLARLLEVDLGFGCGSPGTADAGPLASRAWKSRAAGEDPGGSASEPPLVAPVPLPETSSAPFLNPPKPAWRCAFPLRS